MREVRIDRLQIGVLGFEFEEVRPHADEGRDAVRRKIEPADQFLAARFCRHAHLEQRLRRRIGAISVYRPLQPFDIRAETRQQRKHEIAPLVLIEALPAIQNVLGQRHARRLASARQQRVAERFHGADRIDIAVPGRTERQESPAALGNALQHVAEK